MTDYDQDPPEKPVVWIDLWDQRLTRYTFMWALMAIGMWILIQLLTP